MLKKNALEGQLSHAQREKIQYTSPQLTVYGQVRALTQAGSKVGTENTGNKISQRVSDRLLKENLVRVGSHRLGVGLYLFDYKSEFCNQLGHGRQFGVMADEVETVMPEAVLMHPNGFKQVNYAMLGIYLPELRLH